MSDSLFPYKPTHQIVLMGCDDATKVEIALDPAEVNLLQELADMTQAVGGGCCPTLWIREI